MIPLITKFNSNSVLYDSIGNIDTEYISLTHTKDYIYFLLNSGGSITRYNKKTEELTNLQIYNVIYNHGNVTNDLIYSIMEYQNELYGFNGYDCKKFVGDTVLYIKDNNKLVQQSFDKELDVVHLSSSTEIRDFLIDDDMNYYVLHNKNIISKFSKDRILIYSATITPSVSTVFNSLGVMPNDQIGFFKIDYVREYTDSGLKSYPILLGNIRDGTAVLKPNQLFFCKLDETYANTRNQNYDIVSSALFLGLTGLYYPYGNTNKISYNLTNYDFLKNSYPKKDELVFKIVLQNVYDTHDKIDVEIPISTYQFQSEYHHFTFRLDGINGLVSVFCDGREVKTVQISKGQYIFQDILKESITVGKTYFHNNENLDNYLNQSNYYYIDNSYIKQFKLYKKALSNTEIDYHVYRGSEMNDLIASLPCDQRNELDGIERQFKLDTNGNKSNKINVIIKNSQLTNVDIQEQIKTIIMDRLQKVLPITTTINNIEFK